MVFTSQKMYNLFNPEAISYEELLEPFPTHLENVSWTSIILIAFCIEHIALFGKYILALLIPDVPEFIEEMDNRKESKMQLV